MPATLQIANDDARSSHVLRLEADDRITLAQVALSKLRWEGAELDALVLAPGAGDECSLHISGLTTRSAHSLAERLAALPTVRRAQIEHSRAA